MKTILYLTDFYYQAGGRNYYEEDLYLTSRLKDHFNLLIGHPRQAVSNLGCADLTVFRNTGAVIGWEAEYRQLTSEVSRRKAVTFNSFDGRADMQGKQYLLDLTLAEYPVIPTIEKLADLALLGDPDKYLIKPKNGADSIGIEILTANRLVGRNLKNYLIQPFLDFLYEVSFYYLNDQFQYALYAPDKEKRWALKEYEATSGDLEFAGKFLGWNKMSRGIQRVDACRLPDQTLLLVELEDLNPFLSIDLLGERRREQFVENFITALKNI